MDELLEKLDELRRRDPTHTIFGARAHEYRLNPPLSLGEVEEIERRHAVGLPEDYREFLLRMGNGGAGPFYGVFPFGKWDGSGAGLEPWVGEDHIVRSLADPFPLRDEWTAVLEDGIDGPPEGASEQEADAWWRRVDAALYPDEMSCGWFPICHHGCALRTYLVVSGPERGHVWYDGRADSNRVVPHLEEGRRLTFSQWYERWLDDSLEELTRRRD